MRLEQDILQNTVSESGDTLFRRQERLCRQIGLGIGDKPAETGFIESVVQRRGLRECAEIIRIVEVLPECDDPAVHSDRKNQKTIVVESDQKLIFRRNLRSGRMITQIDAVGKSDMRFIVQKQVDECSVPFGGTNRFTDESCPVIGRIPQVPSKFVGMGGIEYIRDRAAGEHIGSLPCKRVRFGNFEHFFNFRCCSKDNQISIRCRCSAPISAIPIFYIYLRRRILNTAAYELTTEDLQFRLLRPRIQK